MLKLRKPVAYMWLYIEINRCRCVDMHDDILPVCVGQEYIFRSMTHPVKSPCPPYCGWVHAIRRLKCLLNLTNPVNKDFLFLVLYIIVVNVTFQLRAHVKGWL